MLPRRKPQPQRLLERALNLPLGLRKARDSAFLLHVRLARDAKAQGDVAKSAYHAQLAHQLQPEDALSHFRFARALFDQGRIEASKVCLEGLLERHARFWQARWLLAHIAVSVQNYAEAVNHTRAAIHDMPEGEGLWLNLASLQWQAGQFDEAQSSLAHALSHGADPVAVAVLQTRLLMGQGDWDEARASVLDALKRYPEASALRACAVESLLKSGDVELAHKILWERVPSEAVEQLQWLRLRALLHAAQYRPDEAVEALEVIPTPLQVSTNVGPLLVRLRFMQGAVRKALELMFAIDDWLVKQGNHAERRRLKQGFLGGLSQEFGSNQAVIDELAQWLSSETRLTDFEGHLKALEEIVTRHPSYMGLGMIWLNRLRLHRQMQWGDSSKPGTRLTPKRIVQFWDSPQIPSDVEHCMASWKRCHPDYGYERFDDRSARAFLRRHSSIQVRQAFRQAKHPAMRADLFRLAYLAAFGGMYADSDDAARGDLSAYFETGASLVLLQEDLGTIGNNWIASAPKHPWVVSVLDHLAEQVLARQGNNVWFTTGPAAITQHFVHYYREALCARSLPEGCRIISYWALAQGVCMHLPRGYKSTAKHWVSAQHQLEPIL